MSVLGESRYEESQEGRDYAKLRDEMIERQMRFRGIRDSRVLEAIRQVPREEFVPVGLRSAAYDDCALPIGLGQTISQPYTVAFMCEALALTGDETVLEVGTGCGYGAAVLSHLARKIYSIEIIPSLAEQASATLKRLGYSAVHVVTGDGTEGLPEFSPFDGIVVTAGGTTLPTIYVGQLRDGGRVVIPLATENGGQAMYRYTLQNGKLYSKNLGAFAFVPLVGRYGWKNRQESGSQ